MLIPLVWFIVSLAVIEMEMQGMSVVKIPEYNFTGVIIEEEPHSVLTSDCALLEFVKLSLDEAEHETRLAHRRLS